MQIDESIIHRRFPLRTALFEKIDNKIRMLERMAHGGRRDDAYV